MRKTLEYGVRIVVDARTMTLSRTQIDRLGDRLRRGSLADSDLRLLDQYRRSFGEAYEKVVDAIRNQLQLDPSGRPAKSTSSIIEKLHRESIRLVQVQDIAGCRIIVADRAEQERVVAALRAVLPAASVVDRRANPSYGYRAVHVVAQISGKSVEVQVRTSLQHAWAELSEKLSDLFDPAIKYGGGTDEVREVLVSASELVEQVEAREGRISDLGAGIAELHQLSAPEDLPQRLPELLRGLAEARARISERKAKLGEVFNQMIAEAERGEAS